ncbi:hypothetical protein M409DRAFT_24662 [Zasmidium cellare ATCC 36951]|uniref:Uncharacterized protein n=1 Tax=Zasmidium cellare ATCC 36951 TaxID=1080233 RepID=A0A6A6CF57_ZASCE|nr:uncharacterized protein M409DRAFT_24662 [Zasmidium cellare ATCC 36951]KAF2165283.1 hypothetical protein M409DRAFT_24662 [Zasmidium cellare ATCC 36951]
MDDQASIWLSGGQPSSTPPPTHNASSMITYTPTALKIIGQQCSQRLPPANAVQAMFLYELQRQSESEQLFKNQMFRLARSEDASTIQQRRIEELEGKVVGLEKKIMEKVHEERIATSQSMMHMLGAKIKGVTEKVEGLEGAIGSLSARVEEVAQERTKETSDGQAEDKKAAFVKMMKAEIDVLFEDRDGILDIIGGLKARLAELELKSKSEEPPQPSTSSIAAPTSIAEPTNIAKDTTNISKDTTDNTLNIVTNGTNGTTVTKGINATGGVNSGPQPRLPIGPSHRAPTSGTSTPTQAQRLPLRPSTPSQTPLDLSIPKGKAHVTLRGSNHAPPPVPTPSDGNLRPFSPGKQWTS